MNLLRRDRGQRALVGAQHGVRIEHRHQAVEVTLAGGGQERLDHLALLLEVSVG